MLSISYIWILIVTLNAKEVVHERILSGGHAACLKRAESVVSDYQRNNPGAPVKYLCQMVLNNGEKE